MPHPCGATWDGKGTNFALFSAHAEKVVLCLFDAEDAETRIELTRGEAHNWDAYLPGGGVKPRPATTPNGISWCNPDPKQQEPKQLKEPELPTSAKPCPQPALTALGGQGPQGGVAKAPEPRELAPVNGSYGRQLSLAWEGPATMTTPIPAAEENVSGYKALYRRTVMQAPQGCDFDFLTETPR